MTINYGNASVYALIVWLMVISRSIVCALMYANSIMLYFVDMSMLYEYEISKQIDKIEETTIF